MEESQKTDQGVTQEPVTTQAGTDQSTPNPLQDEIEKMKKLLEDQKKEISGLNRKISDDEKLIKQKELEALKGVEREKAEVELAKAEKERVLKEVEELKRSRIVDKALSDAGIPLEFAKRISGQSEEEITADVKEFNEFIESVVKSKVEKAVNTALAGKAPAAGAAPTTGDLQAQYNEAKKTGNFALQNALLRQAAKEGITLQ